MTQFDFPFHFDGRGRTASADLSDHCRDLIEQLLMTEPGERVNRPDFGCGLRQLVFAPNSPELAAALQFSIGAAFQRWLGDVIEVRALEVSAADSKLTIDLTYLIRSSGEERQAQFVRAT
ncbi:MAG TPA: GPW/gp25 family protein [Polyangiales bacterium]|jgi:phage baseplate assembly protein W|nr:GPW/gp25 family protein [Polyangiales bacterium]